MVNNSEHPYEMECKDLQDTAHCRLDFNDVVNPWPSECWVLMKYPPLGSEKVTIFTAVRSFSRQSGWCQLRID